MVGNDNFQNASYSAAGVHLFLIGRARLGESHGGLILADAIGWETLIPSQGERRGSWNRLQ